MNQKLTDSKTKYFWVLLATLFAGEFSAVTESSLPRLNYMPKYDDWLKEFLPGKTEIPALELSSQLAVHSIKRYIDEKRVFWETAITYTGRLVIRSGILEEDSVTVCWSPWKTLHEISVSKTP